MPAAFIANNVTTCIRVDLTTPQEGDRYEFGEIGRRIYRATAGMPTNTVLQIIVSEETPTYDELHLPDNIRIQIVAPDAQTMTRWNAAIGGAL